MAGIVVEVGNRVVRGIAVLYSLKSSMNPLKALDVPVSYVPNANCPHEIEPVLVGCAISTLFT